MIKNNKFLIKNLKNVIFIGYIDEIEKLISLNKSIKLKTYVITSKNYINKFKKNIKPKIYKSLRKSDYENYIKSKVNIENTLFISLGSRWIFSKEKINNFYQNNIINYHGARLPLDKGGGGFSWRIMLNDRIDCSLFHCIDEGIDAGKIVFFKTNLIPRELVVPKDYEKFKTQNFIKFYSEFIKKLKNGNNFSLVDQPEYFGSYYPRLNTKINGWIDWNMNSHDLLSFINAFDDPYEGAATYINNQKVFLKQVQLHGNEVSNHSFMCGIIRRIEKNFLVISTVDKNTLIVEKVLNKNKTNIITKLKIGDRFYTPSIKLDLAKSTKVKYTSISKN